MQNGGARGLCDPTPAGVRFISEVCAHEDGSIFLIVEAGSLVM
jgi:hypothetical protein